jgi:deoxycytidine triphosphate deaminase
MSFLRRSSEKQEMNNSGQTSTSAALPESRRESESAYLKSLPSPEWDESWGPGVLLADQIERAVTDFKLIDPFIPTPERLRPAGYELSVGDLYSINGEIHPLNDRVGSNEIVIKPFDVVLIQTRERLNMPDFLIARWNLTVGRAYEGLLWVGAAQVDPGFKGYLCCPIYNLSDCDRRLKLGEPIAVIDFVVTTPPNKRSENFRKDFTTRKRLLFEDYAANPPLKSALVTHVQKRLDQSDKMFDELRSDATELRSTVFNSVGIILAAIGVLVTALALFVSNAIPTVISRFSPALLVACASLVVSLAGVIISTTKSRVWRHVFFCVVLIAVTFFLYWYANKYPIPSPKPGPPPQVCCQQAGPSQTK